MPEGESKGTTITLRMRPDEADKIRAAAEADGLSLSAWARRALLRAASK